MLRTLSAGCLLYDVLAVGPQLLFLFTLRLLYALRRREHRSKRVRSPSRNKRCQWRPLSLSFYSRCKRPIVVSEKDVRALFETGIVTCIYYVAELLPTAPEFATTTLQLSARVLSTEPRLPLILAPRCGGLCQAAKKAAALCSATPYDESQRSLRPIPANQDCRNIT